MKIRSDFVSNSSSCSFVIDAEHISKACNVTYNKLKGLSVPYDIDNDIRVLIFVKNKNIDELYEILLNDFSCLCKPTHFSNEDPEDINWDYIDLDVSQFIEFANIVDADNNNKIASLIEQIKFDSDDYGSGPMNLRDFYEFFSKNDCKPDAHNSEHEFTGGIESDFRCVLKGN